MSRHWNEGKIEFNGAYVLVCNNDPAEEEIRMIRKYRPKHNRMFNGFSPKNKGTGRVLQKELIANGRKLSVKKVLGIKADLALGIDNKGVIARRYGTSAQNVYAIAKGRSWAWLIDENSIPPNSKPNGAKLTREQVLEIRRQRSEGVPVSLLAKQYGVGFKAIGSIDVGRTWQ